MMVSIAVEWETDKPFHQVPKIKTDEQHLYHLPRMYLLMPHQITGDLCAFSAKEQSCDVDGIVSAWWQYAVSDNLHRCKDNKKTVKRVQNNPIQSSKFLF
jgi:hypothetical protein